MARRADINKELAKLESKSSECVELALKISGLLDKQDGAIPPTTFRMVQQKAILNFDCSAQLLVGLLQIRGKEIPQ